MPSVFFNRNCSVDLLFGLSPYGLLVSLSRLSETYNGFDRRPHAPRALLVWQTKYYSGCYVKLRNSFTLQISSGMPRVFQIPSGGCPSGSRIDCYVHVNFVHGENTQLNFLHSQQILTKRQSSKASRSLGDVPPGVEPRNPSSMQY